MIDVENVDYFALEWLVNYLSFVSLPGDAGD